MPFRKVWPDGSMHDYKNGYRNAEQVQEDRENGTELPLGLTAQEKSNFAEFGRLILVLIAIIAIAFPVALFTFGGVTQALQEKRDIATITYAIENGGFGPGATVLNISKDEALIFTATDSGMNAVRCDISVGDIDGERDAYLFCGSAVSSLRVNL